MKIKKINFIKDFGSFIDFNGQSLPEFTNYNFFYGWNYSGKTTLSRLFSFLGNKKIPSDYQDSKFEIETDNGNITEKDIGNDFLIRVFNEEFIEENFRWNDENQEIEPVFILGKEAKELEDKIKEKNEEIKKKENDQKKLEEEKKQIEKKLEESLTGKASDIRESLNITNPKEFDKSSLKEKIDKLKETYENKLLDKNTFNQKLNFYNSEKKEKINFQKLEIKATQVISTITEVLQREIKAQQIIKKLQENPELSKWVYEGIKFHKNVNTCQFCGNKLPENLLEDLDKHFSIEYTELIENLDNIENQINDEINKIDKLVLPDKARFFKDFHNEWQELSNQFEEEKNNYINNLKLLKQELLRKRNKPFEKLEIQINFSIGEIQKVLDRFDEIVKKHNKKVDDFLDEREKTKVEIINHFTSEFIKNQEYFKTKEKLENIQKELSNIQKDLDTLTRELEQLQSHLVDKAIGPKIIEEYLNKFSMDKKLKIELTKQGKYKLYRENKIAKYLSTGEKNLIALSYFFAKLDETNFDFNNAVIFIDDPISSLDSNHLYYMYGFLCEKFSKDKFRGQLFITTHNYDFFNLLKDFKKYDLKNNGNLFLIKMTQNGSVIETLPPVLENHKSEYNYLFSIMKNFIESSDKGQFEMLFILPNVMRRFLEQYINMRYPDGKTQSKYIKEKVKNFFKDQDQTKLLKILKILDDFSHQENIENSKRVPDLSEIEESTLFLLQLLEEKDKEHYESLLKSFKIDK